MIIKEQFITIIAIPLCILGFFCWIQLTKTAALSGSDFIQDYIASQALKRGMSVYGEDFDTLEEKIIGTTVHENFHLPTTALLALPFSYLTPHKALWLWNSTNLALYVSWIIWICSRMRASLPLKILTVVIAMLWYPFFHNTGVANLSVILSLLFWLTWLSFSDNKDTLAGIFLGTAALIKLFPFLILPYFLAQKRFKVVFIAITLFCGGMGVFSLLFGTSDWFIYFSSRSSQNIAQWINFPAIQSFPALLTSLFFDLSDGKPESSLSVLSLPLGLASGFLCLLFSFMLGLKTNAQDLSASRSYALSLILLLVTVPVIWSHFYIVLLPTIIALAYDYKSMNPQERMLFVISLLFLSFPDIFVAKELGIYSSLGASRYLKLLLIKLPLLGTILFFFLLCRLDKYKVPSKA
jgi:hypothetical protein